MIKPIPGLDGYFASESGEIYSTRISSKNVKGDLLLLKLAVARNGYLKFSARKDGKNVNFLVHRAIALAWLGERTSDWEVCHNDGNKVHNALSNLRWDTRIGNSKDKWAHGTQVMGESAYNARLTLDQVKAIRNAYDNRCTEHWGLERLAKEFGVHKSTVNDVAKRRTWVWA